MLIKVALSIICQTLALAKPLDDQAGGLEECGGFLAFPFVGLDFREGAGEEVKGEKS